MDEMGEREELAHRLRDSTSAHWLTVEELRAEVGCEATEYALFVRHELGSELAKLPKADREQLLRFIASLRSDPFQKPDQKQVDAKNVPYFTTVLGEIAVCYWVDHAMCELRVLDIIGSSTEVP